MVQKSDIKKYWFKKNDLIKPIEWNYFNKLSNIIQDALELYMRGDISIGKAAQIAHLSFREFDKIRSLARIPIHM